MQILNRYILRSMVWSLIFGVATVVFLFLMQFLMNNLPKFVGKGLGMGTFVQLIAYSIPWMMILAVPMGFLFSMLMGFGTMSANQEITIIKSSGGSLFKMMRPVLVLGIGLTIFLFWFNDQVLPEANHQAKILFGDMQRKKPTMIFEAGQFSTDLDGYSILSRRIDTATNILHNITIYDFRRATKRNIITADSGVITLSEDYSRFIIDLQYGQVHSFTLNDTSKYQKIDFENYKVFVSANGFGFNRSDANSVTKGDREQSLSQMKQVVWQADSSKQLAIFRVDKELNEHLDLILNGALPQDSNRILSEMKKSKQKITTPTRQISNKKKMLGQNKMISGRKRGNLTLLGMGRPKQPNPDDEVIKETVNIEREKEDRVSNRVKFLTSKIAGDCSRIEQYEKRMRKFQAEIHKKYAIPCACLAFVLIGCPLGIMSRRGNFGFAASISLVFYVLYWGCLITGEDFADRGILDPGLSMWFGDIVIGGFGILLTLRVNYESLSFLIPNFLRKSKKKGNYAT